MRTLHYEVLNTSSHMVHELLFNVAVGLIFQRLRELPLGFRRCPAGMRGIFVDPTLPVVHYPAQCISYGVAVETV
jgi:hypothetical protein